MSLPAQERGGVSGPILLQLAEHLFQMCFFLTDSSLDLITSQQLSRGMDFKLMATQLLTKSFSKKGETIYFVINLE